MTRDEYLTCDELKRAKCMRDAKCQIRKSVLVRVNALTLQDNRIDLFAREIYATETKSK